MARYYFPCNFFHWGFMSVVTHRPLLLFCYERWACRQNIDQVSKDSMFKHNTFTCIFTYKKVKLMPVLQQQKCNTGGFLFVCFSVTGRQIETLKVAAEPCGSLIVLDWDPVLYVKLMCCYRGKDVPPPRSTSFGVEQHLLQTVFHQVLLEKTSLFQK